jgi:hypothetical protein
MKLKDEFVLRQVADTWVVMPLGQTSVDFNGMLTLNDSGALLWQTLEKGGDREALADALTGTYDVSREEALQDADAFVAKLVQTGCMEL